MMNFHKSPQQNATRPLILPGDIERDADEDEDEVGLGCGIVSGVSP